MASIGGGNQNQNTQQIPPNGSFAYYLAMIYGQDYDSCFYGPEQATLRNRYFQKKKNHLKWPDNFMPDPNFQIPGNASETLYATLPLSAQMPTIDKIEVHPTKVHFDLSSLQNDEAAMLMSAFAMATLAKANKGMRNKGVYLEGRPEEQIFLMIACSFLGLKVKNANKQYAAHAAAYINGTKQINGQPPFQNTTAQVLWSRFATEMQGMTPTPLAPANPAQQTQQRQQQQQGHAGAGNNPIPPSPSPSPPPAAPGTGAGTGPFNFQTPVWQGTLNGLNGLNTGANNPASPLPNAHTGQNPVPPPVNTNPGTGQTGGQPFHFNPQTWPGNINTAGTGQSAGVAGTGTQSTGVPGNINHSVPLPSSSFNFNNIGSTTPDATMGTLQQPFSATTQSVIPNTDSGAQSDPQIDPADISDQQFEPVEDEDQLWTEPFSSSDDGDIEDATIVDDASSTSSHISDIFNRNIPYSVTSDLALAGVDVEDYNRLVAHVLETGDANRKKLAAQCKAEFNIDKGQLTTVLQSMDNEGLTTKIGGKRIVNNEAQTIKIT